jgi:CDP-diacylglycerol---glycerol-3-phosphate 3-phosphatidyltransferase
VTLFMNTPTMLTFFRLACIPLFVLVFYASIAHHHLLAACVFALAAFTDYLDGYLARQWSQVTRFGSFLDPVVDKLMIIAGLLLLVDSYHEPWLTIAAYIIIIREVAVSALREWMAQVGSRQKVNVKVIARIKTLIQMFAITGLILLQGYVSPGLKIFFAVMLYIAVALTIWSMIIYLKAAWFDLSADKPIEDNMRE